MIPGWTGSPYEMWKKSREGKKFRPRERNEPTLSRRDDRNDRYKKFARTSHGRITGLAGPNHRHFLFAGAACGCRRHVATAQSMWQRM